MTNKYVPFNCFSDRADSIFAKDLASKGEELIPWTVKIAMIPKYWDESEFFNFVDGLQKTKSHWQREIEVGFMEKLEGFKLHFSTTAF